MNVVKAIGVGDAGNNAINRMVDEGFRGIDFIAINTSDVGLKMSKATTNIFIGKHLILTPGGVGNPELAAEAATDSKDEIAKALFGVDQLFIVCGMGGGTGTGSSPVVAELAKEFCPSIVGVVSLPFTFEGSRRLQIADEGIAALKAQVDELVVVPCDQMFRYINKTTNLASVFQIIAGALAWQVFFKLFMNNQDDRFAL